MCTFYAVSVNHIYCAIMFGFRKIEKEPETPSEARTHPDIDDARTTTEKEDFKSQTDAPSFTSEDKMKKKDVEEVSQMPSSSSEAPFVDHGNNEQQRYYDSSPHVPSESSSQTLSSPQSVPIETANPSSSLLTWDEALYQACVKNKTFAQTPQQVLDQHHHVLRPGQDQVLLYTQTDVSMEICKKLSSISTTNSSNSMARRVWSGLTSIASKLYQYTVADPDDYMEQDLESWEQNDDAHGKRLVEWNDSVVCAQLVVECIQQLRQQLSEITAVRKSGTKPYSFATWVAEHSDIHVQQPRDLRLLQQVLIESGHAQVSGDFLILGDAPLTDTRVQVAVSLTQLQEAIEACQDFNERRQAEIENHTHLATVKKRNKDIPGALRELQLCKHLRAQVDSTSAHLLNLHQAHDSLQSAHFQATHVVKPLEDTAAALKALRQDVPLERVDDVMLDLQEEIEHVNDVSERMANSSGIQRNDFDEDELLAELEQMSLQDSDDILYDSNGKINDESEVKPPARSNQEAIKDDVVSNKESVSTGTDVATTTQQVSSNCENDGAKHNTIESTAAAAAV